MTQPIDVGGDMDLEEAKRLLSPEALEEVLKLSQEARKKMSDRGKLGLPELLEKRRWEYAIPDSAFQEQAIYDRCHVWQVSQFQGETYGDTHIYMPDTAKKRELESNPRGILVSAGPAALDALRSNGVELGHLVTFIELSPMRTRQDISEGHEEHIIILSASDVTSSKDFQDELRSGQKRIEPREVNGRIYHMVLDQDGNPTVGRPLNPRSIGEEM